MDDKLEYWIVDMLENLGAAMYEKKMYRSADAMVEMQLLAIDEIHSFRNDKIGKKATEGPSKNYPLPRLVQ